MRTPQEHNAHLVERAKKEVERERRRRHAIDVVMDEEPETIEDQDALLDSLDRQDMGQ